MCLNGSRSGRFGQFCLFNKNNSHKNVKVTDPTGQYIYCVEMNF